MTEDHPIHRSRARVFKDAVETGDHCVACGQPIGEDDGEPVASHVIFGPITLARHLACDIPPALAAALRADGASLRPAGFVAEASGEVSMHFAVVYRHELQADTEPETEGGDD